MPVYTYVCPQCSRVFDVEKSMTAPHPVHCEDCGYQGPLMRRFNQPSIKYRCSGFYTTDKKLDTFVPGYDGPDEVTLMEMGEDVPGEG
nr:hypothetical protein [Anaerolineae bacterium]